MHDVLVAYNYVCVCVNTFPIFSTGCSCQTPLPKLVANKSVATILLRADIWHIVKVQVHRVIGQVLWGWFWSQQTGAARAWFLGNFGQLLWQRVPTNQQVTNTERFHEKLSTVKTIVKASWTNIVRIIMDKYSWQHKTNTVRILQILWRRRRQGVVSAVLVLHMLANIYIHTFRYYE